MDYKTTKNGKWLIIYLDGRLDVHLSQELENFIDKKIEDKEYFLIFNLKDIEYMSSSGLRVFISTMRKLRKNDGELRISNMNESVKKIFKIVELEGLFKIFPTEDEALID